MGLIEAVKPAVTMLFAVSIVAGGAVAHGPDAAPWLSAKTVLMVPGNADPDGAGIESKLNGYFDAANPHSGFPGYVTVKVPWLSDSFDLDPGYAVSQADGVARLRAAMTYYRDIDDADDVDRMAVVGYSAGAIVVIDEMRRLDLAPQDPLSPDQVEFFVFGSPHRPNGGVFARFPGVAIGDVVFSGGNPDTAFELTDIGVEYDPISDFPAYPLMPLTLINAILGFQYVHVNYVGSESDLANAIDDPNLTYYDETRGIRYVTIAAPHLPLLMPLYRMIDTVPMLRPLVEPVLTLVEPVLKVLVDLGYRRDVPVGETRPVGLFPRLDLAKVVADLAHSAVEGVNGAWAGITGNPVADASRPAPVEPPAPPPADDNAPGRDGRRARSGTTSAPAEADRPDIEVDRRDRPRTHSETISGESSAKRDPHIRRNDTSAEARPSRKSGTAKMDSVRTSNRRQAADAA